MKYWRMLLNQVLIELGIWGELGANFLVFYLSSTIVSWKDE